MSENSTLGAEQFISKRGATEVEKEKDYDAVVDNQFFSRDYTQMISQEHDARSYLREELQPEMDEMVAAANDFMGSDEVESIITQYKGVKETPESLKAALLKSLRIGYKVYLRQGYHFSESERLEYIKSSILNGLEIAAVFNGVTSQDRVESVVEKGRYHDPEDIEQLLQDEKYSVFQDTGIIIALSRYPSNPREFLDGRLDALKVIRGNTSIMDVVPDNLIVLSVLTHPKDTEEYILNAIAEARTISSSPEYQDFFDTKFVADALLRRKNKVSEFLESVKEQLQTMDENRDYDKFSRHIKLRAIVQYTGRTYEYLRILENAAQILAKKSRYSYTDEKYTFLSKAASMSYAELKALVESQSPRSTET